ncbi:hypothetical protein ACJX0J_038032 [Zea mays]
MCTITILEQSCSFVDQLIFEIAGQDSVGIYDLYVDHHGAKHLLEYEYTLVEACFLFDGGMEGFQYIPMALRTFPNAEMTHSLLDHLIWFLDSMQQAKID